MGRGTDIAGGVVEDEFAVDPERGTGMGELSSLEEAGADRRTSDPLVQPCQFDTGAERRLN